MLGGMALLSTNPRSSVSCCEGVRLGVGHYDGVTEVVPV